jgi:hypothetical protein
MKARLAIVLAGLVVVAACASTHSGSKPVPPHAIEIAADTKVPDAGDAAAPQGDAAAAAPSAAK